MSAVSLERAVPSVVPAPRRARRSSALWRGLTGIAVFVALWQLGTSFGAWFGPSLPVVGKIPAPSAVARELVHLAGTSGYWSSWYDSFTRVALGFVAALVLGVSFGLLLAVSRTAKLVLFGPFELLRPIPPLAWVPLSILFWPTENLSIEFVIFLGAFYTIVLSILGGARQIDERHLLVARSLGAGRLTIFRRVVLPATLPSIATGAVVGLGVTWEVVVAAELISGGGQTIGGGGLGFLLWNAYQGDDLPQVVVCMISLGLAGYLSSAAARLLARRLMPWREQ